MPALPDRHAIIRSVRDAPRNFFFAVEGPTNLALARIWFFAILPFIVPAHGRVEQMAELPQSLQVPPKIAGDLVAGAHLGSGDVALLWWVIVAGCVLAAVGLFARTAALAVTIALFFYLGETELYGKVNHIHHLVLIAAVFAVSRSADAFSLGTLIRGARGRLPVTEPPAPSRAYALPLRAIWLILGLVYLFPGLLKLVVLNVDWLQPSTLRGHLWERWAESPDFDPLVRVDEISLLLLAGALMTLFFELTFILLLFTRLTRHLAILIGLGFHNSTGKLMGIPFWTLQAMYPLLVDWEWISRKLFARRSSLVFLYDGGCGICKRTVSVMQRWTLPGSVTFANAQDGAALDRYGVPAAMRPRLLEDLHVWDGERAWAGYEAYRRLARRQPFLWPVLPLLYLPPVAAVGRRVYRRVADSRACRVGMQPKPVPVAASRPRALPVVAVAVPIIVAFLATGFLRQLNAWPVAQYPDFAYVPDDNIERLRFEVDDGARRVSIPAERVLPALGEEQFGGLTFSIWRRFDGERRERALHDLSRTVSRSLDGRHRHLWISLEKIAVDPDEHRRVMAKEPLAHLPLDAAATSSARSDGSASR